MSENVIAMLKTTLVRLHAEWVNPSAFESIILSNIAGAMNEIRELRAANADLERQLAEAKQQAAQYHANSDAYIGAMNELAVAREMIYADSQRANELVQRAEAAEKERDELIRVTSGAREALDVFRQLQAAEQRAKDAEAELNEALDNVEDCVRQACTGNDGELDSMALSAYAMSMRFLEKHKRLEIKDEYGKRVIAKWIEQPASQPQVADEEVK